MFVLQFTHQLTANSIKKAYVSFLALKKIKELWGIFSSKNHE